MPLLSEYNYGILRYRKKHLTRQEQNLTRRESRQVWRNTFCRLSFAECRAARLCLEAESRYGQLSDGRVEPDKTMSDVVALVQYSYVLVSSFLHFADACMGPGMTSG